MIKNLNNFFSRLALFLSTKKQRRKLWPPVPSLSTVHIQNCTLVENRIKMLEKIPKDSVCAELGVWRGDFSQRILEITAPRKLYLIDNDPKAIATVKERFKHEIARGTVEACCSDSSSKILSMPDATFDWIYIDGDHSYEGVKKDLEAAHMKLKKGGIISLNDYIFFGPSDLTKYGVIEAANEFCKVHHYEVIYLALNGRMYNDVTIRKIESGD